MAHPMLSAASWEVLESHTHGYREGRAEQAQAHEGCLHLGQLLETQRKASLKFVFLQLPQHRVIQ